MLKRSSSSNEDETTLVKRSRVEETGTLVVSEQLSSALALLPGSNAQSNRRSGLQDINMMLSGHEGAVFSLSFDSTGNNMASSSFDSKIFLWEVYGECKNYNTLSGHKNAILEIKWIPTSNHIISASADKTVALWDANKGERIRRYTEHTAVVNACASAADYPTIFASGSDDCTAVIWDIRHKRAVQSLYHDYQVTSVSLSNDGQYLYTGGIDNIIRRFDLRKGESDPDMILTGHHDTITGLALSPDGSRLLSNAMDSNMFCWDVRPFIAEGSSRIQATYQGGTHGAEKNLLRCAWSYDQNMVTCGSADRMVHVWDALSGKPLYYLPGHKGSVNDVIFHPKEPILASCSTDKNIFLGELGAL